MHVGLIRMFLFLVVLKLFVDASVKNSFNFNSVKIGCTSFVFTVAIYSDGPSNFSWRIKNSGNVFPLANISLGNSGNIISKKLNSSLILYTDYNLLHPPKIKYGQEPIEVKLFIYNFKPIHTITVELKLLTTLEKGVDLNISQTQEINVSVLTCSFPKDDYCRNNCLSKSFCQTNFTKLCKDGRLLVQDCPADIRAVEFVHCRVGFDIQKDVSSDPSTFYAVSSVGFGLCFIALALLSISYWLGYFKNSDKLFDMKYRIWTAILILFGFAIIFVGFGMIYGLPTKKGSFGVFLITTGSAISLFAIFTGSYIILWHRQITQNKVSSSVEMVLRPKPKQTSRYPIPEYLPPYFD